MCDERYDDQLTDVITHPKYYTTLQQVHRILESDNPDRLLKYDQISLNSGNFELLVGLYTCTYRNPCKTTLGDRYFSITQKRFQAKSKLLSVYKEQVANQQNHAKTKKAAKPGESIFDVQTQEHKGDADVLLSAIKNSSTSQSEKVGIESHTESLLKSSASEAISEAAKRESQKSEKDIYNDVFIDEINQELLNSVMKA